MLIGSLILKLDENKDLLIGCIHYFSFVFSLKAWRCQKTIPSSMFLFTLFTPDIFYCKLQTIVETWGWVGANGEMMVIIEEIIWFLNFCQLQQPWLILEMLMPEFINKAYLIQIKFIYIVVHVTPLSAFRQFLVFFLSWIGGKALLCNSHVCVCIHVRAHSKGKEKAPYKCLKSGLFTITTCLPLSWFLGKDHTAASSLSCC